MKVIEERRIIEKRYEEEKKNRVERLWPSYDMFLRFKEMLLQRHRLLNQLYLVYPYLQLQYSDYKESFRSELVPWCSDNGSHASLEAPIIHYRILPNEIVFDIDSEDKTKAKEMVKKVIIMLKSFGAEPFAGFSGNRGYHVHVLLAPPKGSVEDFVNVAGVKEFRNCVFDWLFDLARVRGIDTSLIDSGIMHASEHTIRSFYSFNPKGKKWKIPVYGERYGFWKMPKHIYGTILTMIKERQRKELIESILNSLDDDKKEKKRNRILWIEKILQHPDRISDGRKRLLLHAIIPYFISVKKR